MIFSTYQQGTRSALKIAQALLIGVALTANCYASETELLPLKAEGNRWVNSRGTPVLLKGTNLGNWLVQEFWMMDQGGNGVHDQCTLESELTRRFGFREKERLIKLFRDNWIKERDFDQLKKFGFNVVRLPILWSVIEDAQRPKTLREDAWHYIDWTIAQAKERGMYVILDLHGVHGGQTMNDHTGCSGQNQYWINRDYQERTLWVWQQIAQRYKDEPAVAAFDPINEPWGSTAEAMSQRVLELYHTIRAIDPQHIIILHGHYSNLEVYGDPAGKGLSNVAFQLHPYPGLFGDRPNDSHIEIHRDWLRGGASGKGGVCALNARMTKRNTPLLMGEFQPWQSAGLELGGKLGRATYDTYAGYGWASTSWTYKVVTIDGGQGNGLWGMVTNAPAAHSDQGTGLIAKASSWDCAGWDGSFAESCGKETETIVFGGSGQETYYLIIKTGALGDANLDVSYDSLSLQNMTTNEEQLINGNFNGDEGWQSVAIGGAPDIDFRSIDEDKRPAGSQGQYLRVSRPLNADGDYHGAVYQAVTLKPGHSYAFSGLHKDNGSSDTWSEIYLVPTEPTQGTDILDDDGRVDFTTAKLDEIEALFRSYGEADYDVHRGLAHWLVTDEHNDVFDDPSQSTALHSSSAYVSVPARIEAEQYSAMDGIQVDACGDTGGGFHLGYFDPNDFAEFNIRCRAAGEFAINYRLASETGSRGFDVLIDNQVVDSQSLQATGGWQSYVTQTGKRFALSAGNHTLRFRSIGKEWNINWFELKRR